jgi:bidirectional [NiFe] hydrogenase diaphorase subunit
MPVAATKTDLPSEDKRWRIVYATMRRNGFQRDALIETLHTVQESFGYVDDVSLKYVARTLRVPLSAAYGVVTFYHFFSLKPQGKHTCVVCTGTACYIKQAAQLMDRVRGELGIGAGETTPDGLVSVLEARCVGSCGIAPVVVNDGVVEGNVTPDKLAARLEGWRHGES